MNTTELLSLHSKLCDEARELMGIKNQDYAGKGGEEPFLNFSRVESMGITTTERGFLVRMIDKMSRLSNLIDNQDPAVADEKFEDTIIDLINYSVLLYGFRLDSTRKNSSDS